MCSFLIKKIYYKLFKNKTYIDIQYDDINISFYHNDYHSFVPKGLVL